MASYNLTRETREILKRYRKESPSLVLHLYSTHFRFEGQHGNFNYDSPMKCFLEAIREQKLPTDLLEMLEEAEVKYYEGFLIVEVHDHRLDPAAIIPPESSAPASVSTSTQVRYPRQPFSFASGSSRDQPNASKAEVYRIVLGSNPATLWTELGILNEKWSGKASGNSAAEPGASISVDGWTESQAVELEAEILARTMPPLCLSPSIQVSRIANTMLRATTLVPPKRKRFCHSGDANGEEEAELEKSSKRERDAMMKIGEEGMTKGRSNAFSRLAFIQALREKGANPAAATAAPVANSSVTSIRLISSTHNTGSAPSRNGSQPPAGSPPSDVVGKRNKKKKILPGTESESGTPAPPTKRKKVGSNYAGSPEPLEMSPEILERDREKKKAAGVKRRAEAKAAKAAEAKW